MNYPRAETRDQESSRYIRLFRFIWSWERRRVKEEEKTAGRKIQHRRKERTQRRGRLEHKTKPARTITVRYASKGEHPDKRNTFPPRCATCIRDEGGGEGADSRTARAISVAHVRHARGKISYLPSWRCAFLSFHSEKEILINAIAKLAFSFSRC